MAKLPNNQFAVYALEFIVELIPQKSGLFLSFPSRPRAVVVHPHLFGQLAKTDRGFRLLRHKVKLKEMCNIITDASESIINRRSALWSVSHIAMSGRLEYIRTELQCDLISTLMEIAEKDPILSLRGSAYMILTWFAAEPSFQKEISARGWYCSQNGANSICVPQNEEFLFSNIICSNWPLPICSHFQQQPVPKQDAPPYKVGDEKEPSYSISTICPSDVIIPTVELSKEERHVFDLICRVVRSVQIRFTELLCDVQRSSEIVA